MDILACPATGCRSSLELDVFASHTIHTPEGDVEEIDEALITCPRCRRWYPVIDGIACMLPDDLRMAKRQRDEETTFLIKWRDRISPEILERGVPFGLESQS